MKWFTQKISPQLKNNILTPEISKIPLPPYLIFPLIDVKGNLLTPCVKVGDSVLTGQALTTSASWQHPIVHASTSGTVREIKEHPIVHSTLSAAPCLILEVDGHDNYLPLSAQEKTLETLTVQQLQEKCHQAGIVGLGGAGFPTAQKCVNTSIEMLIINGMECEPPIAADDILMQEYAEKICSGAAWVQKIVSAKEVVIAIEKEKTAAIAAIQLALKKYATFHLKIMPGGYPSGSEKNLIHALTGKEISRETVATHEGFLMVNVATAAAVHDALIEQKPLISRIMTLAGSVFSSTHNIEVLNGTPINWLLAHYGLSDLKENHIIQGGSLMGIEVKNAQAPISKITNCLWVEPYQKTVQPEQACVRCGFCVSVCPANLLPQQLYWFIQGNNLEEAQAHHLNACIECGACAYVCPSNIPLVEYYQGAKQEIKQIYAAQKEALAAKERYEARQQRLSRRVTRSSLSVMDISETPAKIRSFSLEENIDKKAAILAAVARRKKNQSSQIEEN